MGSKPTRVLVITHDYPPSRAIGAQAPAQLVRYLPRHGCDPIVLTAAERYLDSVDPTIAQSAPGHVIRTRVLPHPLALYRWSKGLPRSPVSLDGKAAARAYTAMSWRRWVLSMLTIPDPYAGWFFPAVVAGLRAIRAHRVDHVFSTAPWWTNHLVGLAIAKLTRLPWTAHFRDPWTQVPPSKPASRASQWLEERLEGMVIRAATHVVCVTEEHTECLRTQYRDVDPHTFVTIPNGFDPSEWMGIEEVGSEAQHAKFLISYAGSLYNDRNPQPLFRALQRLALIGEIDRAKVEVRLCGVTRNVNGDDILDIAERCGVRDLVIAAGAVSRRDALGLMARSDLLLLLGEGLTLQIPGKTYEYLSCGRPILALTPSHGALASLLRRSGGAWVVDPSDDDGIAAAVKTAYRAWAQQSKPGSPDAAVVAGFDRRVLAQRFAQLFRKAPQHLQHPDEIPAGRVG
jgi:glycosyltransferase involved in cell wall biosynthesis